MTPEYIAGTITEIVDEAHEGQMYGDQEYVEHISNVCQKLKFLYKKGNA